MSAEAMELLEAAARASEKAHAPYSNFRVGAALRTADGRIYSGCNVENMSYGLTNCAERTAMFKAVSEGEKKFAAIAITCADEKVFPYPCGACRQVMSEFFGKDAPVYVAPNARLEEFQEFTVGELLPKSFDF
jgi:cytidine deaminase